MSRKCRKCGYERPPSDAAPEYECPNCGAIYAKVEEAMGLKSLDIDNLSGEENILNFPKFMGAGWNWLNFYSDAVFSFPLL